MPIDVVCPGCLVRFKVSDQHAGKKGLCPKCKHEILVPSKKEQVVVHAPEDISGPKDAKGRPVLKPIEWEEMQVPAIAWVIAVGAVAGVFALAWIMRTDKPDNVSSLVLGVAAILIGGALSWAMWWVFRNEDLETFDTPTLLIRAAACGLGYAVIWGIYAYLISDQVLGLGSTRELMWITFLAPLMALGGTFVCAISLKLDFPTAVMHYLVYLTTCVLLRLTMGLPAF